MRASRNQRSLRRQRGFTLIEVIVTLVIAGLLGALLVNMLGTTLLRSSDPATSARQSAQAESDLEAVVATYVAHVNANTSGTLAHVQAQHPANATLSYATVTMDGGIDALRVTATVGQASVSTLLTQARTNGADSPVKY